jgi:hypothetical protein
VGRARCCAAALLFAVHAPHAHHSIASVYDSRTERTLEGVVERFDFVNPHPVIAVDVDESTGPRQWRLEMDNRFELAAIGFTSDTIRRGDRIVVSGSPARNQTPALYIRRLDRPADGFWYEQVGARPRAGGRQ